MEPEKIPKAVDEMVPFLFFDFDEALIIVAIYGMGIIFSAGNYALLAALVIVFLLRKFKLSRLPGLLQHVLYWRGVISLNKVHRNGLMREWLR